MGKSRQTPEKTPERADRLRRQVLGALAIVLCLGAVYFHFQPPRDSFAVMCQAACQRMGPVAALLWLAYYEIIRLPTWLMLTVPVALLLVVIRPRLALYLVPIVMLILILRPRKRRGRR